MFKKTLSVLLAVIMLCAAVPLGTVQAFAAEPDAVALTLGVPATVTISNPGEKPLCAFTPAESGTYLFSSSAEEDTYGTLYNAQMETLESDDDSGGNGNFLIVYTLTANETYYLEARFYSADDTGSIEVEVIKPEPLTVGTLMEGSISAPKEKAYYSFTPEHSGYYEFTFRSTAPSGSLYDAEMGLLAGASSSDEAKLQQELTAGETYFVVYESSYAYSEGNMTGDYSILVTETVGLTDLTILTPPDETTLISGYEYNSLRLAGMVMQLTWSDGQVTTWAYGSDEAPLRGLEYSWRVDTEESVAIISCGGQSDFFAVTIAENPVSAIVLNGPAPTIVENTDGYWSTRYDDELGEVEYFYYSLNALDEMSVTIYMKDGTSETVQLGPDSALNGYPIFYYTYQSARPFTVGSDNPVFLNYLGVKTVIYITITESPVRSIEVTDGLPVTCIEEYDGYWANGYNPVTDQYDLSFFYYAPELRALTVTITMKDGTVKTAHIHDEVDGYTVDTSHTQWSEPWTVGGENLLTVSYRGAETKVPVTITPNPVEYLSVPDNTALHLIEYADGYFTTRINSMGEEEKYFYYYTSGLNEIPVQIHFKDGTVVTAHEYDEIGGAYLYVNQNQYERPWVKGGRNYVLASYLGRETRIPVIIDDSPVESIEVTSAPTRVYVYGDEFFGGADEFYPNDYTGLAFTVHFKDGISKSYTDGDIKGSMIDGSMIDGHSFRIEPLSPTQTVGENTVTMYYLGGTGKYSVTVRENDVKAVAMTKLPDNLEFTQYYHPDWYGAQITVTKKDDTKTTVTLSKDNVTYHSFMGTMIHANVEIDDMTAVISTYYEEESLVPTFRVSYADVSCMVTGMTYREESEVTAVEVEDFSATGENMLVKLTREDGSTESFRMTDVTAFPMQEMAGVTYYAAMTDKGLLPYAIISATDTETDLFIFGLNVDVDGDATYYLGDVDGDGRVTVDDATLLQRYLAEYSVDNARLIRKCGDANKDGKVDVRDVTAIQRYLADTDNPTGIGEVI